MNRVALSCWDNRIAPVFDVARHLKIVDIQSHRIHREWQAEICGELPVQKVSALVEKDVSTLVCGAVSKPLYVLLMSFGIRVIPFIAGDLATVIRAYLDGTIEQQGLAMPGFCRRGQSWYQGYSGLYEENVFMNKGRRGMGQGQQGRGRGRMGGAGGGMGGYCVCPQCGYREKHERGVPCSQKQCPSCGTSMIRGV